MYLLGQKPQNAKADSDARGSDNVETNHPGSFLRILQPGDQSLEVSVIFQ
jgi:hypothetical protein